MFRSKKANRILRYLAWIGAAFASYVVAADAPDASFAAAVRYSSGASPYCVAVGDLNGDGIPDIVSSHQSQAAKYVSVFLGTGSGNFAEGIKYPIGGPAQTV